MADSQAPTFSFVGIINTLNNIAQSLYKIQQTLGNSYISTSSNNIFTGTNTFQGKVTLSGGLVGNDRNITSGTSSALLTTDYFVTLSTSAPYTLAAPSSLTSGAQYIVHSASSQSGSSAAWVLFNFAIDGSSAGSSVVGINTAFGTRRLYYGADSTWHQW